MTFFKDVNRTHYNTLFYNLKKNKLKNILNAYYEFILDIKYSSGMNWIASILLFNMDEKSAFWFLVSLFHQLIYNNSFQRQSSTWNKELSVFDSLLKKYLLKIINKFDITSIANLWIITLFSYRF